jgi:hypothetical protein
VEVRTVTTADLGLLQAVRETLNSADHAYLCVAFAHERGVRLLGDELEALRRRNATVRMLVTTAFDRSGGTAGALAAARSYGVDVRVHNHAGGTYHPKLYLGVASSDARAVIGSANLTGGLACNVELGVSLCGSPSDAPLANALEWAEDLWAHSRSERWDPTAAEGGGETIEARLLAAISQEQRVDPVFTTVADGKPNRVVAVTPSEVLVETERTRRLRKGPQSVPAWMLNIAWEWLTKRGELANTVLLNELRVHRSSAVCAMLARVPGVRVVSRSPIVLAWNAQPGRSARGSR